MQLTDQQKENLRQLYNDLPFFAKNCLKIRTKEGAIKSFELNKAQLYLHKKLEEQKKLTGKVRAVILKGRQQGCSTYVAARFYHQIIQRKGSKCFILTHRKDATDNLYKLVQRYHDNVPQLIKPSTGISNATTLYFDSLDSGYSIGTAGGGTVGRSDTIQLLHGCLSEDSLIVLADGSTRTMKNIKVGDEVVTSNGHIASVSNKIYTGKKQTFRLDVWVSGEPIYLTENHKVLTIDGYKQLKELSKKDYVALPKMSRGINLDMEYVYNLPNKERPQGGGAKHKEQHNFKLNENFGYFLGYYLAEGHIKDNLGQMEFTYHQKEVFINKALKGIQGLSTSIQHSKDTGTNRARTKIYGKFLASAINEICGRVENKHIPSWFFCTPKEFQKGLLNGYLDGDGSKTSKDRIVVPSVHEKISRQIQRIILALELGSANIRKSKRHRYEKRTRDIYSVKIFGDTLKRYKNDSISKPHKATKYKIKDGQIFCKVKNIEPRKIERVWDIEVNHPDHNYQTTSCVVSNSEVAFWENADEISTGIMQTIADAKDTEIILESTANGIGNLFHKMATNAMHDLNNYQLIFIPWFWQDEYRTELPLDFKLTDEEAKYKEEYKLDDEQIAWRRNKIANFVGGEWQFKQEYPANAAEAFQTSNDDSLIQPKFVTKARKAENIHKGNQLVVGVDPAHKGKDKTAIVFRDGRVQYKHELYSGLDTMEVAGRIIQIITHYQPEKIFIDIGGIGAGIYDRLKELGYSSIVTAINFGQKADEPERYLNKRAEMWSNMNEWLKSDVKIEDDDNLHSDLIAPNYTFDSQGRLKLESKDDIKKRYLKSPDLGDALALTFAYPVPNRQFKEKYGNTRQVLASTEWNPFD